MAGYSRKELQILGGQFNLLPPGDKIPITDYILIQNFRPDRIGKLVSRYGFPSKFQITGIAFAHSAAVMGGPEGNVYVAGNTSAGASSLYFNFTATLASEFDGNRVAMVPLNGWMWIMNAGKQGRHGGAGGTAAFEDWNLAEPTTAPIASAPIAGAVVATVTYNYDVIPDPTYVHFLKIAGTTYQFSENGYSGPQIPLVIRSLASADPNCTVTYSGSGTAVVITPIPVNTLIQVSGSDGNPDTNLGTGTIASVPLGTYQYYVTFATADDTLESNPSPASSPITVISQAVILTNVPVSPDARVEKRNIYATGGTLGQAYLVGTIPDNTTTTITIDISDLEATNNGVVMPVDHDAPPACAGMVGPYYGRLIAFCRVDTPNRLFWTDPQLPQYWPGAADDFVGNWVDVGDDGEKILWCTCHTNILIIYKEKSIWRLLGDPDTGTLERMADGVGLVNAFACISAGPLDYFVGPNGLYRNDLNSVLDITGGLRPLFDTTFTNTGPLTAPGSIIPGPAFFSNSLDCYGVALGYAMGKLYLAFQEKTSLTGAAAATSPMLIYHEASDRWMYYRNSYGLVGFKGFYFDGVEMVGLTGNGAADATAAATGWNIDDFQERSFEDDGSLAIECVYQSHYEDAGVPDSQKAWLEVVVDCELLGDTATVYVGLDTGTVPLTSMGTITGSGRQSKGFPLAFSSTGALVVADPSDATQKPCLAKNLSVAVDCAAHHPVVIHNVYLYYYEEARLAVAASTLPTDLGVGKVKQCKELELDLDASSGAVALNLYSDLPGNALAIRHTQTIAIAPGGRAIWKYPFAVTEGFLWKIQLLAAFPFRLYSARLLMRPIGVYMEAYEAAAGFVWDSQELSFDSGITHVPKAYGIALASLPIKRFREISLEIDTFNADVTLNFLTDLPGNVQTSRKTATVNTGTAGRRFFRVPLPAGTSVPIEGRLCRLQLSGVAKFVLYAAAVETLAIGVYVEAYEAASTPGAVWDSREQDFTTPAMKEARELELDIETTGDVTWTLYGDNATTVTGTANTTLAGRQKVMIPLTVSAPLDQFVEGRLYRLILSGLSAFRLYGARIQIRAFGQYLSSAEGAAGALWDSTELDLGTQTVKQFREVELDIMATDAYTVVVYTDLPGNAMGARVTVNPAATTGRTKVQIPLTQGTGPDNYIIGRLVRVTVQSTTGIVKLFGARIGARAIGVYVEAYEASGGAFFDSREMDLGTPAVKEARELELDVETTGAVTWTLLTDMTAAQTGTANTTGRQKVMIPLTISAALEQFVEARLLRLTLSGTNAFRLYGARIRIRPFGQYLTAAENTAGALWDTTELDLGTQTVKQLREIELDLSAAGAYTVTVYTDLPGNAMAVRVTSAQAATSGRTQVQIPLPQGAIPDNYTLCRLVRVTITGASDVKLFGARIASRAIGVYIEAYEAAAVPGAVFDTREMDFGTPAVKETREIELDIATTGDITWTLLTDLTATQTGTANTTGRQKVMIPLTINAPLDQFVEARMYRLILSGTNAFALYGARARVRPFGQYLTAVENAAGALWDSTELDLGTQTVKQIREVELDLWAYGAYTVTVYTDLPGNAMGSRAVFSQAATSGRTQVQIPLQQGGVPDNYFFGRLVRVTLTSASSIKLFGARIHARAIGVYVEAYEAAGGAVWDSSERDLGNLDVKQFRELQLEIGADGPYNVTVYTDLPENVMTAHGAYSQSATTGRTAVVIPLPQGGVPDNYMIGRLVRVVIRSAAAFQLYDCKIDARVVGVYVEAAEGAAGAVWDSSEFDLGTQTVKQIRELQLDIGAVGAYTVKVYTDLPGNVMTLRVTANQPATTGRTAVMIPLRQGAVPDNYFFGRLIRVVISSSSAFQLYGARIDSHIIGLYVETYEAAGGAVWDSLPQDLGNSNDKTFDQVHVEMDSDGAANVAVYTDLPGETFVTAKGTFALTTGGTSRHWATVPLPAGIEGRSVRLVVSSSFGFRIYKVQVRAFQVGRYLCAHTASNADDKLTTLDFDFRSERRKLYKKIEVDMRADVAVTLSVLTEQSGQLAEVYSKVLTTPTGRAPLSVVFPPGVRGRLLRLSLTGGPARIYHVRVWEREVTEPGAKWAWNDYPLEESDVLPKWTDLPVPETPPMFTWSDLPGIPPTPPNFTFAEMGVTPTPDTFTWSDLPVEPTPPDWKWMPLAVTPTPNEYTFQDLPVEPTPPDWKWANLAVTPTPNEYTWSDLPVAKTEPAWAWAPFPVAPTGEWFWARVLSVEETPDTWELVDVPFGISGN